MFILHVIDEANCCKKIMLKLVKTVNLKKIVTFEEKNIYEL